MATFGLARRPTCLSCLRQQAVPLVPAGIPRIQVRGKKNYRKKGSVKDGQYVRFKTDITGFGPKGSLMRVKPGRFRNFWQVKGMAEQITKTQWKAQGFREEDLAPRDPNYSPRTKVEARTTAFERLGLNESGAGQNKGGTRKKAVAGSSTEKTVIRRRRKGVSILKFPRRKIWRREKPPSAMVKGADDSPRITPEKKRALLNAVIPQTFYLPRQPSRNAPPATTAGNVSADNRPIRRPVTVPELTALIRLEIDKVKATGNPEMALVELDKSEVRLRSDQNKRCREIGRMGVGFVRVAVAGLKRENPIIRRVMVFDAAKFDWQGNPLWQARPRYI